MPQFSLFRHLPAELQLHVLTFCRQNDLICLSLASHFYHGLTLPMIPSKPSLQLYDQNLAPDAIVCSCGNKSLVAVEKSIYAHRRRRHAYVCEPSAFRTQETLACQLYSSTCRDYPEDHAVCEQRGCRHCICIGCPLYVRLRSWFGDDLRYCTKCRLFTRRERTKKYKGRCLHGRPRVRRAANNHWTAVKGQSYGYRWWRRWGTQGVDNWGFDDDKYKKDDPSSTARRRNARVV
ncbi:F-box domain-containing protein [Microdochium bolleyi]|uniref:F-box domain-containing protein n=1 Tax=Microdochium bolleyi TaxID=196109 RepID=A0A136J8W9_9PEZI|nr:F-box domain-containing protein [Microdochium bolleyi]